MVDIINNINSKRYSTRSPNPSQNLDLGRVEQIFNQPSVIIEDPNHFLSHTQLVRKWIYVYKNGQEVEGSPFKYYSSVKMHLGLKTDLIVARYIDTHKIYQGEWTFYSCPWDQIRDHERC